MNFADVAQTARRFATYADLKTAAGQSTLIDSLISAGDECMGLEDSDCLAGIEHCFSYRLSKPARQRLVRWINKKDKFWSYMHLDADDESACIYEREAIDARENGYAYIELSQFDTVSGHTELLPFDDEELELIENRFFKTEGK